MGTQDTGRRQAKQINVREYGIDNPEKLATLINALGKVHCQMECTSIKAPFMMID